ncbi:hypothetical protein LCGC14_0375010 [marine sediment metagenome]|uniref:HTH cro/C1-type domain-containing protein n=1 Tax=marine sediment metagenome TaxID=412755 RepID=A0A0F9T9T9_9ZZZZ
MNLKQYCDRYGEGTLKTVAKDSEITLLTLRNIYNGMRVKLYPVARAISKATGWRVTIPDLCEEGKPNNSVLAQFKARKMTDTNRGRHRARLKIRPMRKG